MKTPERLCAALVLFMTFYSSPGAKAQSITGLWEVKQVTVDKDTLTPVAKWMQIDGEGSYTSGNGWLQNGEGSWTFDRRSSALSMKETRGLLDPFGPFKVTFAGDSEMRWERVEEGARVLVHLQRVEKLPRSIADEVQGLWDLKEVTLGDSSLLDSLDPGNRHYLFIRWDRVYVERTASGKRATGYWHMHGHRPELTLLSHLHGRPPESWRVSVSGNELKMTGVSETNRHIVRTYLRLRAFPD